MQADQPPARRAHCSVKLPIFLELLPWGLAKTSRLSTMLAAIKLEHDIMVKQHGIDCFLGQIQGPILLHCNPAYAWDAADFLQASELQA